MANIIIGGKVHCPLCGKEFSIHKLGKESFYVCRSCLISINFLDEALGKWDLLPESICKLCHKPMKQFYRNLDGFRVYRCETCKIVINVGKEEYLPKEENNKACGAWVYEDKEG